MSNKKLNTPLFAAFFAALLLPLLLNACTLNEGDPQTTLCQKLTAQLAGYSNVQWSSATRTPQKDKSLKVEVRSSGKSLHGICIYQSDSDDAGKDYDVNILDSYQNIPTIMVINGKPVTTRQLDIAIQKVTGQSIRDTLKKGF